MKTLSKLVLSLFIAVGVSNVNLNSMIVNNILFDDSLQPVFAAIPCFLPSVGWIHGSLITKSDILNAGFSTNIQENGKEIVYLDDRTVTLGFVISRVSPLIADRIIKEAKLTDFLEKSKINKKVYEFDDLVSSYMHYPINAPIRDKISLFTQITTKFNDIVISCSKKTSPGDLELENVISEYLVFQVQLLNRMALELKSDLGLPSLKSKIKTFAKSLNEDSLFYLNETIEWIKVKLN